MDQRFSAEDRREIERLASEAPAFRVRESAAWQFARENRLLVGTVAAVAAFVFSLFAISFATSSTKSPSFTSVRTATSAPRLSSASSPGYRLAVIDGHNVQSDGDVQAVLYDRMLELLAGRCANEDARGVADIAVVGARLLRERGVDANAWTVLAGLDAGTAGGGGFDCDRIAAAFVTITASFAGP